MYCTNCLSLVGPYDRACAQCAADLTFPGSVRLTDPRRLLDQIGAPDAPSAGGTAHALPGIAPSKTPGPVVPPTQPPVVVPAASGADAEAVRDATRLTAGEVESTGPGWWHGTKAGLKRVGERAAAANRERRAQTPNPVAPSTPAMAAAQPLVRVEREPGELNIWDDYGMADTSEESLGRSGPPLRPVSQLLGATVVPSAKVAGILALLGVVLLVLLVLAVRLLTLDSRVAAGAGQSATPAAPGSVAPVDPAPEQETPAAEPPAPEPPAPEPPAPPPGKQTPAMLPGAKECDPGLWAGQQTSCALAAEVAGQLRLDMTGSVVIEAFSTASNRTYRLECVAVDGITCTGLDGVEGLYVWIVTEG